MLHTFSGIFRTRLTMAVACATVVIGAGTAGVAMADPTGPYNSKPITIEFAGGSVPQFVEALKVASGDAFNPIFVREFTIEEFKMQPVTLKNVTADDALRAINSLTDGKKRIVIDETWTGEGNPIIRVNLKPVEVSSDDPKAIVFRVYAIDLSAFDPREAPVAGSDKSAEQKSPEQKSPEQLKAQMTQRDEVRRAKLDSLMTDALAMAQTDGGTKPEFRINTDAQLLLFRGTCQQAEVVEQVCEALTMRSYGMPRMGMLNSSINDLRRATVLMSGQNRIRTLNGATVIEVPSPKEPAAPGQSVVPEAPAGEGQGK
jgi:hypothetical protein